MSVEDRAVEMLEKARQHEERYLLPRRYRLSNNPELDALYEAAEWLVNNGYARWISLDSSLHPGIILTGKPLPSPPGA